VAQRRVEGNRPQGIRCPKCGAHPKTVKPTLKGTYKAACRDCSNEWVFFTTKKAEKAYNRIYGR